MGGAPETDGEGIVTHRTRKIHAVRAGPELPPRTGDA
jgi:hypothetical protein